MQPKAKVDDDIYQAEESRWRYTGVQDVVTDTDSEWTSQQCLDISVLAPAESVMHTLTTSWPVSPVFYTLHNCRVCDAHIHIVTCVSCVFYTPQLQSLWCTHSQHRDLCLLCFLHSTTAESVMHTFTSWPVSPVFSTLHNCRVCDAHIHNIVTCVSCVFYTPQLQSLWCTH